MNMNNAVPRLNVWRAFWNARLGSAALLGLALLAASALLSWWWRPSLAQQQQALAAQRQALLQRAAPASDAALIPAHAQWLARLPAAAERGPVLARLLTVLDEAAALAEGADYAAEAQAPGLLRLRVTIPVQGRYAPLRELVARLLQALPNAALDALVLERSSDPGAVALHGRLQLSLFFRQEAP
jgi:hypothetical protein